MNYKYLKYNQKIKFILACISLIICLSFIKETYAKYITEASGQANITIAKWKILVNNEDVINNNNITQTITPNFTNNENIKDNVIAPGATGYFDLIIDPTNTDVTFSYEITTSIHKDSSVQDLIITGYSKDEGETITFSKEEEKKITDIIFYNPENKSTKIRVYITWQDDETELMNNQADTSATLTENSLAKVNVNIKFIQKPNATPSENTTPTSQ